MLSYIFIGTVLVDSVRITSTRLTADFEATDSKPACSIKAQVIENHVLARVKAGAELSDDACYEIRELVRQFAYDACIAEGITGGVWVAVAINECIGPSGNIRMSFDNRALKLRNIFARRGIDRDDLLPLYLHEGGYFLRLALHDINSGLADSMFMRSHFYRAMESLRNSVAPKSQYGSVAKQWEVFRGELGLKRGNYALRPDQAERHADYTVHTMPSRKEVHVLQAAVADVVCRYVKWFKRNKL